MVASSYDQALTRLLRDEGEYTDHPSDPGGPTNFGITLSDARRYWKGNATADDVRVLPQSVARKIYRERYWNAMRCDELPAGVDYAVFDYGVNSGIGRAGKVLRRVLGMSDVTSAITDDVIASVTKRDASDLVKFICTERLAFLRALKTFPVFGRGWTARVNGVRATSLAMAQSRAPVTNTSSETSAGKAVVPAKIPAGQASAGAVIAAGAVTGIATSRLDVAAIVVVAAALTAAAIFLIWRWRNRAQQEAAVALSSERASHELG